MHDLVTTSVAPFNGAMTPTPLFDYDALLLSGLPIYVQNGIDYTIPTERVRTALHQAARARGLKVTTRVIYEYDGIIFQAYLPGNPRPLLPPPPVADFTKESHEFLFCSEIGCDNRLRPTEQLTGKCATHT